MLKSVSDRNFSEKEVSDQIVVVSGENLIEFAHDFKFVSTQFFSHLTPNYSPVRRWISLAQAAPRKSDRSTRISVAVFTADQLSSRN